jgi:hypothetical protein
MEDAFRIGDGGQWDAVSGKATSWQSNAAICGAVARQMKTVEAVGENLDETKHISPTISPIPTKPSPAANSLTGPMQSYQSAAGSDWQRRGYGDRRQTGVLCSGFPVALSADNFVNLSVIPILRAIGSRFFWCVFLRSSAASARERWAPGDWTRRMVW